MVAIFVVATVLVCLAVEILRHRATARASAKETIRAGAPERFLLPRGFFLGRGHSWVELLFSGHARMGLDDFAQKVIGAFDKIEVVPADTMVRRGDVLARITHGSQTLAVTAPISGKIVRINEAVLHAPETIRHDPYVSGWIAEIVPSNVGADLKLLSIADDAANWLRGEVARFRDFIRTQLATGTPTPVGATLLDGGVPLNGVMEKFSDKTWKAFQQEFLEAAK